MRLWCLCDTITPSPPSLVLFSQGVNPQTGNRIIYWIMLSLVRPPPLECWMDPGQPSISILVPDHVRSMENGDDGM